MNLTDQAQAKLPEFRDFITSEQNMPDIDGINNTGSMGESGAAELTVIARIPDLDAPAPPPKHKHRVRSKTVKQAPAPNRLLNAGLSLNLLVGLGLVLLAGSVVPFIYNKIADDTQSKADKTMDQAWQSPPPAPTADLAQAGKPSVAQSPSASQPPSNIAESKVPPPAELFPSGNVAAAEKDTITGALKVNASNVGDILHRDEAVVQTKTTLPPLVSRVNDILAPGVKAAPDKAGGTVAMTQPGKPDLDPADASKISPWPRSADDQADFSPWPNPAHPTFAKVDTQGVNEAATADRRNATISGGAAQTPFKPPAGAAQPSSANNTGAARFDAGSNTPSDRNTYDSPRPSFH